MTSKRCSSNSLSGATVIVVAAALLLSIGTTQAQDQASAGVLRQLAAADTGDGRRAEFARLVLADGLAIDADGHLYVADQSDHRVRRRDGRTGLITTVIGTGVRGAGSAGEGGTTFSVDFGSFFGSDRSSADLVLDSAGRTLYVTDFGNDRILAYDTRTGVVRVVAGGGPIVRPGSIALRADRWLYVGSHAAEERVVEIDLTAGAVRTLAPGFAFGAVDRVGVDGSGHVYVYDHVAGRIHRITGSDVSTLRTLGTPSPNAVMAVRGNALFFGEGQELLRRDLTTGEETVAAAIQFFRGLEVAADGTIVGALAELVAAGDGSTFAPLIGGAEPELVCGDEIGGAQLRSAFAVAAGPDGRVYLGDGLSYAVTAVDERTNTAEPLIDGALGFLRDLTVDRDGNVYALFEDFEIDGRDRIYRVDGASGEVGITTFTDADFDKLAASKDGSLIAAVRRATEVCYLTPPALEVLGCVPYLDPATIDRGIIDVALDEDGELTYVADRDANRIIVVETFTGDAFLFAGSGSFGFGIDGSDAASSPLDGVAAVDVAWDGSVVFLTGTQLWRVDAQTGVLRLLAFSGRPSDGVFGPGARLTPEPVPAGSFDQFFENLASRLSAGPEGKVYFSQLFQSYFGVYEPIGSSIRLPEGTLAGAHLGAAVAASGQRIAIGTPDDAAPNGSGSVAVYRSEDCKLVLEQRITVPAGFVAEGFGAAVALDGDRLLVGTRGAPAAKGSNALRAAIFERLGTAWNLKQPIDPAPEFEAETGGFGQAVALDGPNMIIGAPEANGGDGTTFTFRNDGATWENIFILRAAAGSRAGLGASVAASGGRVAVGASGLADASVSPGFVAVYEPGPETLDEAGFTLAPDPDRAARFGDAIALSQDRLLVGAPEDGPTGGAYLYDIDAGELSLAAELRADDGQSGDRYGEAVTLDGGVAVVGAPRARASTGGRGALYGYTLRAVDAARKDGGKGGIISRKIPAAGYQQGLGVAATIAGGRPIAGAPQTGGDRGDAIAAQIILNLTGVAGLWFDANRPGEGYNVIVADEATVVYYYGFDPAGRRLWLVSESLDRELTFGQTAELSMFDVTRGTFAAPVPSQDAIAEWGNLRLTLNSAADAVFELHGAAGSKISRASKLLGIDGENAFVSGLWFDPNLEGEGYNVISSAAGTVVYYYGSTASGERLWLVSDTLPGQPEPGSTIELELFETRGGSFDQPADPATALRSWGSLRATFGACGEADFELAGRDGSKRSDAVQLAGTVGISCPGG